MDRRGHRIRLLAVAAAYGIASLLFLRVSPSSVTSAGFVVVAMICFLGLAFVARPVVPIRIPRALRRIRPWEIDGGFYRAAGVPAFGGLLRRTPLRLLNRDVYLGVGARDTATLSARLEAAEASHFWAAALVAPYMARAWILGAWGALFWVSLAQLLVNAYPIMHLRLTRGRLDRLASKTRRPRSRSG